MCFISLCLLIHGALHGASELMLNTQSPNFDATITALNILATQKTKHSQQVIHKYYERIVKDKSVLGVHILVLYRNKTTINEYVIMLLVNRWKDHGLYECLEVLYGIRSEWWHVDTLRSKIISIIDAKYKKFRDARLEHLNKNDLREYCRMISCYSFCKCMMCSMAIPDMLRDKRVVFDFNYHTGLGIHSPMASRVCDYALMALMAMYQVDVSAVSRSYGYPLFFNNQLGSPQKQVEATFDAMLADIDMFRERFFR